MQIVADVCRTELVIPEQQIGASYGDAFLAATGIGLFENLFEVKQWISVKETVKPDPNVDPAYDNNYRIFRELYNSTKNLMHELAESQMG
jgi:xylulokinase